MIRAYERGRPTAQIARVFDVSPAWARRVKQRLREGGESTPRKMGSPGVRKIDRERLAELVKAQPDATLKELRERLGVQSAESAICTALKKLGLSFKKKIHAAEQDRPDVAERRESWKLDQPQLDPGQLIFVDETWAKTNMARLRGRAPRVERLIDKTPHGHWKTTSLIAALGVEGVRCSTVVDGPINRDVFDAFVEQVLVPELRPGDAVILDNLSSHKSEHARRLIESRGAKLVFLPPCSPDLNPIEMVFAKIKQLLRSLGCRTKDALWNAMQSVLDQLTPTDATNCFRHSGYSLRQS